MKLDVQIGRPDDAPMHGCEHLDVVNRVEPESLGNPLFDQADDQLHDFSGIFLLDEIEIVCLVPGARQVRHLPLIDPVGADDNRTFPGLPENLIQFDHGNGLRFDEVSQNITGADGGELIDVPHQD